MKKSPFMMFLLIFLKYENLKMLIPNYIDDISSLVLFLNQVIISDFDNRLDSLDRGQGEITLEAPMNANGHPIKNLPTTQRDGSDAITSTAVQVLPSILNHSGRHQNAGDDEISVLNLSGLLADDQNPVAHAADHQNTGGDEINVADLSGLLADDQNPVVHAGDHENGGEDEISVLDLSGLLADLQNPVDHTHQSAGSGVGGQLDHGLALTGLSDDADHPGYTTIDGTRTFTGNQSFGDFNITNVGDISLDSISADGSTIAIGADGSDIGIGTSNIASWHPAFTAIHIGPDSAIAAGETSNIGAYFLQNAYFDDNWRYRTSDEAASYGQIDGTHYFQVATSGTIDNVISWATPMVVGTEIVLDPANNVSFSDKDIINVGNIGLDSISADASTIAMVAPTLNLDISTIDLVTQATDITLGNFDNSLEIKGVVATVGKAMIVVETTGPNNGFGLAMNSTGAGNNNIGFQVGGVAKASMAWDNVRDKFGFVNFDYSASDFSLMINSDGSLSYQDAVSSTEVFSVTNDGEMLLTNKAAAGVALTIKGAAGQSDNLLLLTDSAGNAFIGSGDGLTGSEFRGNDQQVDIDWAWEGNSGAGLFFDADNIRFGIGTESPVEKLTVNGNINLPKASGNGIKIDGSASTFGWRDLEGFEIPDPTGGDRPTLSTYSGGAIKENAFSNGDVLRIRYHIPHDYVKGTDIFSHIHWSHNGTAISGNVVFGITSDYAKGHNQANFGTEKVISITYDTVDISTTPQYRQRIEESVITNEGGSATLIDRGLLEPDGVLLVTFEVTTNPTITGGSPNNVFVHRADLHYQSSNIGTKDKAPDFYV
jgi:hypothetical protein